MSKYWVVDGCELKLPEGSNGEIKITSDPESDVFAGPKDDPKKVFAGKMSISVSNFQDAEITDGNGTGTGNISGSSTNKANGKNILLEGDSVDVTITGTSTKGSSTEEVTKTITVKIKNAGQSEVSSN